MEKSNQVQYTMVSFMLYESGFGYTLVLKCYYIPDPFVFELTSNGMSKTVIAKLLSRF